MLRTIRTIGSIGTIEGAGGASSLDWIVAARNGLRLRWSIPFLCALLISSCAAQQENKTASTTAAAVAGSELNVNWLYGSYVPKDVPLEPLSGHQRFKLYLMQTYTTPGIYVKTTLFALHDQISDSNPEWGDGFGGFAKRWGNRQVQFIIQNSITSLGNGVLGWEPRYDRCRCEGFWPRTQHALVRNFVTYDRTEKSLRPQIMPFLGAFGSSAIATAWAPGNPRWEVRGYQAVVTQVFVGAGINWLGEFAPEIVGVLHRKKPKGK
jgi:hypothetical protein